MMSRGHQNHDYHMIVCSIKINITQIKTISRVLIEYDQLVSDYYKKRTNGARVETWSDQVQAFLSNKPRLDMLEQLNKAGFMKR